MSCFRCGKDFEPNQSQVISLIELDEGPAHALCCTKEELVGVLTYSETCLYEMRLREAWHRGKMSWFWHLKNRFFRRKRVLSGFQRQEP